MKYYNISFPGEFGQHVDEIWSEKQILDSYYPYWCGMMVQNVAAPDLNPKTCIEDWCVTHWAIEVPKPEWITESVLPEWIDEIDEGGYSVSSLETPQFKESQARYNEIFQKERDK